MKLYMKKITSFLVAIIIITATLLPYIPAQALSDDEKTLHIVSANDTSPSLDRIVYQMYQRIGYNISIEAMPMKVACETANSGEVDGMEDCSAHSLASYPNLTKIPEPIATTTIEVYSLSQSSFQVNSWDDLRGLRVGMMYQKLYIEANLPNEIASLNQ